MNILSGFYKVTTIAWKTRCSVAVAPRSWRPGFLHARLHQKSIRQLPVGTCQSAGVHQRLHHLHQQPPHLSCEAPFVRWWQPHNWNGISVKNTTRNNNKNMNYIYLRKTYLTYLLQFDLCISIVYIGRFVTNVITVMLAIDPGEFYQLS